MDGQVRQWRRLLHEWDPQVIAAKADGTYVAPNTTAADESAAMEDKTTTEDASSSSNASECEMVEHTDQTSEDGFVLIAQ
jgi:hypothetical protein